MAHQEQRGLISRLSDNLNQKYNHARVLEIGSLDINGSVRDFFTDCDYVGIDIGAGKGVDIVCEGQKFDAPDDSYDQVISCEVMEHNPYWIETFKNMIRMCKPGGLVVMTCATIGRPEHGTTRTTICDSPLTVSVGWDYYLNLRAADFQREIDFNQAFSHCYFKTNWLSYDLYFFGIKRATQISPEVEADWSAAVHAVEAYLKTQNSSKRCRYRAAMARLFGGIWFDKMRALQKAMVYMNG
jgi:SAM-dependent methyltransferase